MRHHRDKNPRGSSHMSLIIRISNTCLSLYITCTNCILLLLDDETISSIIRTIVICNKRTDASTFFHRTNFAFFFFFFKDTISVF